MSPPPPRIHMPHKPKSMAFADASKCVPIGVGRAAVSLIAENEVAPSDHDPSLDPQSINPARQTEQLAAAVQSLTQQIAGLEQTIKDDSQAIHRTIVEIAISAAERLLFRAIEDDRQAIHQLVAEAISATGEGALVVVQLNPDDAALLGTQQTGDESYSVESNEEMARGNCEANIGALSCSLDWRQRLSEIGDYILDRMHDETPNR